MSTCPRCQAEENKIRTEHKGLNTKGELVWTIFNCESCAFTWRDSEPARTIDYNLREEFFRVDPEKPYPVIMPPAQYK
jgi:C4-type Zn-finger protein